MAETVLITFKATAIWQNLAGSYPGNLLGMKSSSCQYVVTTGNCIQSQESTREALGYFSPDDIAEIMVHVRKFIETVLHLNARLTLCLLLLLIISISMLVRANLMPSSRVVNCSHFQQMSATQVVMQSVILAGDIQRILQCRREQKVEI